MYFQLQPISLMQVPSNRATAADASVRTVTRRMSHVQAVREVMGVSVDDEIKALSRTEREKLLAGISLPLEISVDHSLAMKSNLSISWNKLRTLRQ